MNLLNLHYEMQYIAKSNLYRFGANGDNRLMAAICLFMNLSHQLDFGNYSIIKIEKLEKSSSSTQEKDYLLLLQIQQSLLFYSACFDTILQFVYFATHISSDFTTEEEYKKEQKKVTFNYLQQQMQDEPKFKLLVSIIDSYYKKQRKPLADIINSIKHRGGISLPTINKYIPEIANCSSISIERSKSGAIKFLVPKDFTVVKASWFYPLTKSIEEYLSILETTNGEIVNFAKEVLGCLGINCDSVNDKNFSLQLKK